jgi:hypothetical protein
MQQRFSHRRVPFAAVWNVATRPECADALSRGNAAFRRVPVIFADETVTARTGQPTCTTPCELPTITFSTFRAEDMR